jgi:DNA repair protein RadA/Sms
VETVVSTRNEKLKIKNEKLERPQRLSEIKLADKTRISTGIGEFDRVLGGPSTSPSATSSGPSGSGQGGLVPGSVILLAGEPGIGKSTLLLQAAEAVSSKFNLPAGKSGVQSSKVLYVSGEESPQQIKIRAERLGIKGENLLLFPETDVDAICAQIEQEKPLLCIIDSIQTLVTSDLSGTAGSIGQVRESAARLAKTGKNLGIPIFLIGHVTKEGAIAGPMVLEHLVDVVLFFEGERFYPGRTLRSFKNRFGPTDEVGIFEMAEKGLVEISNPSELFLHERDKEVPGSVIVPILEGTRPILVEIQALANQTSMAYPRRVASGFDPGRLSILTAIISRRLGLPLGNWDVFVNIPGGLKVREPAVDLGVALAIISSFKNKPLPRGSFAFGEVGLLGEVRRVLGEEKRVKEAKRLGFTQGISPGTCASLSQATSFLK